MAATTRAGEELTPPGPTPEQVGDALDKLIATARANPQNNHETKAMKMKKGAFPSPSPLQESIRERFRGVDRLTVSIYAILALYEHGHITERKACELMCCSDIVSFRIRREEMFQEMCRVLELPLTPRPLPMP